MYDPKQRITAKQALKHPWFKESLIDDGTEAIRIRDERAAATAAAQAHAQTQQLGPDLKRPRV